ncbi:bifunctional FolC family protein [Gracilibacillus halophilus YIM-C55.5]|uniref:tetrahydrofolate synthase n=1 Tax=Gracilibacillus halophilus YIM-C55.5 TaxID=1308866 RepID=N4WY02_9BACI|nr:folylpolyglutamate synthase/dihydrofolate synthase family protein [Gracilibacillus halophilus]ENH97946.1 bifunctional FolC family protein [Gracilibacillus halophilus YIM-C55.5]
MLQTYKEAEEFLWSRRGLGIKPGFERLDILLEYIDHPENTIPTIHIAGTNGKGSTLTFIANALQENGYRVGTFTSPGLPSVRDHMAINHHTISKADFLMCVNRLIPIIQQMDHENHAPTEYEILMAITLLYFKENVDIAVIETCMGGREDVTNRVNPIVTVITTVGYDHMTFLGHRLIDIASHKAGIMKTNVPVIVGNLPEEALAVVEENAKQKQAPSIVYDKDFFITDRQYTRIKQSFTIHTKNHCFPLSIQMAGVHQTDNATLAFMALQSLQERGYVLQEEKIADAFYRTVLPLRIEKVQKYPDVLLDGAHNTASTEQFVHSIDRDDYQHIYVLFSAFRDKQVDQMLTILQQLTNHIIITSFPHPRSLSRNDLSKTNHSIYIEDAEEAYLAIKDKLQKNDLFIITGSLHFVSYMRQRFWDVED